MEAVDDHFCYILAARKLLVSLARSTYRNVYIILHPSQGLLHTSVCVLGWLKKKELFSSIALELLNNELLVRRIVTIDILLFKNNIMASSLGDNKIIDDADSPNNESELKVAFARQTDELRLVKRQLANSQLRIKELEEQIIKLQNQ